MNDFPDLEIKELSAQNVATLREIYTVHGAVFDHLHEDFILYSPGNNKIAGVYVGAEGMKKHFDLMDSMTENTLVHNLQGTFLADEEWGNGRSSTHS